MAFYSNIYEKSIDKQYTCEQHTDNNPMDTVESKEMELKEEQMSVEDTNREMSIEDTETESSLKSEFDNITNDLFLRIKGDKNLQTGV